MFKSKYTSKWLIVLLYAVSLQVYADIHWSYKGNTGPRSWGTLDPQYSLCTKGKEQSPIDISNFDLTKNNPITFHYKPIFIYQNLAHKNVYFRTRLSDSGYVKVNGDIYKLRGFHFHAPSEHTINGKYYPLELHLVHENERKETLVVSVFIKQGKENDNLDDLIDEAVTKIKNGTEHKLILFNPAKLLPKSKTHFQYAGSLTTPPCSEGVIWILLSDPIQDSKENIKYFKTNIIDHNSRFLQKLNHRLIYKVIQ